MTTDIVLQKREFRRQLRAVVKGITAQQRQEWSQAACERLGQQEAWRGSRSVLLYATLADELDLTPMIGAGLAQGKTMALPRFVPENGSYMACVVRDLARDCAPGSFGIVEPSADCREIPLNRLDLVLVPGVGFDPQGYRLGRGRGFYDRLLAEVMGIKCGIAFDAQMVERIPTESHDVQLDFILTPSRWLEIVRSTPHNLK